MLLIYDIHAFSAYNLHKYWSLLIVDSISIKYLRPACCPWQFNLNCHHETTKIPCISSQSRGVRSCEEGGGGGGGRSKREGDIKIFYFICLTNNTTAPGPVKSYDGKDNRQLKIFLKYFLIIPPLGRSCASCKSGAASGKSGEEEGGGEGRGGNISDLATTFTRVVTSREGDWRGTSNHSETARIWYTVLHLESLFISVFYYFYQ